VRAVLAGLLLLALGGCTVEAPPSPAPVDDRVQVVDALWDWDVRVRDVPIDYAGALDEGASVRVGPAGPGGSTAVVDVSSRRTLATLRPTTPGRTIGAVAVAEPYVVWSDYTAEATSPTLHVLDARSGEATTVDGRPGVAEPGAPPTFALHDHRLAYTTQDVGSTSCLVLLDLRTWRSSTVHCTDRDDQGVGDPTLTAHGLAAITFDPRVGRRGCARPLFTRRPGAEPLEPVPGSSTCWATTALVGPDFVAWDDQRPRSPDLADLLVHTDADGTRALPRGDAGTLTLCGEWIYWTSWPRTGERTEVRRWRPGADIEVVHRSPSADAGTLTAPQCHGDRLTFTRTVFSRGSQELLTAAIPVE
jgi:hypothetical protein